MQYSVIIPVYNRPDEIHELLSSLTKQTYKRFEVLIIEDGSENRCESIVHQFSNQLDVHYYYKENSGQGFSRNFGFERAKGDYFVVFDSDCLIPPHYFETVTQFLSLNPADCWGGPDKAHYSFTPVQKAINYSMTSFLTTGGIRGKNRHLGEYHPRSFNMGISRRVWEITGGYKLTRMGEDLEFSIRIIKAGFKIVFIEEAFVYHKRRTDLKQFFWQLHFFGRARINIIRLFPEELKPVHLFPVIFLTGFFASFVFLLFNNPILKALIWLYFLYALLLFLASLFREKSPYISFLTVICAFTQLSAYAFGFMSELRKIIKP